MCTVSPPLRVLIVPGLHDSGPQHWQTQLQRHHRSAVRVVQPDWSRVDLHAWADQIRTTLAAQPPGPWLAVAHSFGCLALVRALLCGAPDVRRAVLVAPACPTRLGVAGLLPPRALPIPITLVASRTDPWMSLPSAARWADAWGAHLVDAGEVGHINVDSGHGAWPLGRRLVERHIQKFNRQRHLTDADVRSLSFSI